MLIIDADTYEVKRSRKITEPCSGSTSPDYMKKAGRIFVVCENDNLIVINYQTLETEAAIHLGQGAVIIGDEEHGLLYVAYSEKKIIHAFDAATLQIVATAKAPKLADKMVLSGKRKELYVPATRESEVWV